MQPHDYKSMSERMSHPFPPKHSMHWRTSPYTYEQAVSEYDAKGHLLDLTEKPTQASDDQAGSPPEHSLFWQGQTEPKDPVTSEPIQWIEIRIVDEFNQPLDSVVGKLTDANGKVYPVRAARSPIYVQGLAAGQIALSFENQSWFECVEKRKPNLSADDPVQGWLDENPLGKRAAQVKLLTATAGDFVELTPNQSLAQRHHAGQADDIALETGNSYLIRIQGFNYISLRIGVFFDGTANNSYNAIWGKQKLDEYADEWIAAYQQASKQVAKEKNILPSEVLIKDLPNSCFSPPNDQYKSSAANEITNIQKLYELYLEHDEKPTWLVENNEFRSKLYITGIGTGNSSKIDSPSADFILGIASGAGEYGVVAKVNNAVEEIKNLLDLSLEKILIAPIPFMDGIGEIVFDVFGFSRGAAAARHFINLISDGELSELACSVTELLAKKRVSCAAGFCWQHSHWRAGFVGLFDTVASVIRGITSQGLDLTTHNTDNGDVRLWINERFVDRVVHITANPVNEYRFDFSLNKLNSGGGKKFQQFVVPGAHSDVGGGYHSRSAFKDGFLLPLLENVLIDSVSRTIPEDSTFQKSTMKAFLIKQLLARKQREAANGWPVFEPEKYYTIDLTERRVGKQIQLKADLRLRRVVEGDLSRIYLRLMFGLAEFYGVRFVEGAVERWNKPDDKYFHVQEMIGDMEFSAIAEQVLNYAKQGAIHPILTSEQFAIDLMRNNLIHHSSSDNIGMKPNHIKGLLQYRRAVFNCAKDV